MESRTSDRRAFTVASALALLGGVTITVTGCGGAGSGQDYATPPTGSSGGGGGDVTGLISSNHGHAAVVTAAQLAAGSGVVLNIQGEADHPHVVELSPADLGQIAAGMQVSKSSSTGNPDAHWHTVLFSKGGSEPGGPGY